MRSNIPELVKSQIRGAQEFLEGEVLTNPALLRSGETGELTWAVDVAISGYLAPIDDRTLKNVPVAMPTSSLHYAQRGMPVTLRRTRAGATPFEVVGPAKVKPVGGRWNTGVDVATGTILSSTDYTVTTEVIEFGDYAVLNAGLGFGTIPFGARALYQGGVFVRYV